MELPVENRSSEKRSCGLRTTYRRKAIPGQVVDANSTANFGVGAFLLAACEYVRYLEAPKTQDRAYWCDLAYKMAAPILSNMAKGELQKT